MNETDILSRPLDLTPRLCHRCRCAIRDHEAVRRVSERGCVQYEHTYDCMPDPDRCCAMGEAREVQR